MSSASVGRPSVADEHLRHAREGGGGGVHHGGGRRRLQPPLRRYWRRCTLSGLLGELVGRGELPLLVELLCAANLRARAGARPLRRTYERSWTLACSALTTCAYLCCSSTSVSSTTTMGLSTSRQLFVGVVAWFLFHGSGGVQAGDEPPKVVMSSVSIGRLE
jgi:hypothetical protein